jgi:hypothetical protein
MNNVNKDRKQRLERLSPDFDIPDMPVKSKSARRAILKVP